MTRILRAAEAIDSPFAGGKARGLARAERAGLPVPPWFVVAAPAVPDSLTRDVRAAIDAAVGELCPNREAVAVRSSATDEDSTSHSFAGQLESFLSVAPEDVVDRVRGVWHSAYAPRVLAYQREHGLPRSMRPPAVIVQRMILPRASGVAFSADPVSGRRGVTVVSAVRGLGCSLVSGETDADTWRIDRSGAIIERRVVTDSPALADEEVIAVARLAKAAERHFDRPQDIEWAIADRLVLLQSRPITSLHALPDPDAPFSLWDNSNIVESYSGVTTPLTFSFAREIYRHVYQQFCRMMGVPERVITHHDETFRNMLGLVRGRLYYNLLNWYRMLSLLPGYRVNRRFMEQMMGVKEALPDCVADEVAKSTARGRVRDAVSLLRTLAGLLLNLLTLDRRVDAFCRRLDEALKEPSPSLEDRRPDELVAHYRELRGRLLLRWDAPLVNDFFTMIFYGLLRHLGTAWCGDREGTLQNDLIGGDGCMLSAEPAVRMQRLARLAAVDPALMDRLTTGSVQEILAALEAQPELLDGYRAYLARFGERTVNELKLESATLHDDPLLLFRAIGALASQLADAGLTETCPGTPSSGENLRVEARARVKSSLAYRPLRRTVFNWVLRHARRRVRDRENLRLDRTRLFGRVRRVFLELGRRLHALDVLDDPRDVLYLEVDEVLAFVDGRSTCTDLRSLAAVRKREFRKYREEPAPDDRFETRGTVYRGHDFRRAHRAAAAVGDECRGLGCSPGVVRGRVRIVTDPNTADLSERSILVAEHTDPGWILLFPSALGILVERGSLLSHAAIVARELGIPAVVSASGITRWLQDGDFIEMDGATGIVRRIGTSSGESPSEAARPPTPSGATTAPGAVRCA
jgi:pyruvate,water dikinase